ncbi:MAG: lytic transglycosylase domain-containing protein, partial [Candidatus Puniceispirillaceae bacterium]
MPSQAEMSQDLPAPLSDFDVAQYQRLFHLQEVGRMKQATREMFRLENDILRGHLLSQRYLHPTAWRSTYKQLSSWLKVYNDHPDASRIFWLAKKRRPKNAAAPKSPKPGYLNGYGLSSGSSYRPRIPMYTGGRASPRTTRRVAREVRRAIRRGWPSGALEVVDNERNRRYLTKQEEGQLRGEIAHAYFIFGVDDKAIRQARHGIGAARDGAF